MSPKRLIFALAVLVLSLLTGASAWGQEAYRDLPAAQLFDQPDVRPYGTWDQPKEGFFLSFDGIFWTISAPKKTTIGAPGLTRLVYLNANDSYIETNTMDTGELRAKQVGGNRIEFGYTGEHHGFLLDTFELNGQTQHIYGIDVPVVFVDRAFGPLNSHLLDHNFGTVLLPNNLPLPVVFGGAVGYGYGVSATNRTQTDGMELLYTYRQHPFHYGGQLQWMVGGRYLRFDDEFTVSAEGGVLDRSEWDTTVRNRIWGPEVGVRFYQPIGRWGISAEGRFMAGMNNQDMRQGGMIGSELAVNPPSPAPTLLQPTAFDTTDHKTEFTPLVEFRVEAHAQLTRLLSFKAGWTGIFMDGIARPADMVEYQLPNMGILTGNNRQTVFMQGFNFGLELNR